MKKAPLFSSLALFTAFFVANNTYADCCPKNLYDNEYCQAPLECGDFALEVSGGIAPTIWRHNNSTALVNQDYLVFGPVFELPKFSTMWHLPVEVMGKLDYAVTDHIELFAEGNYRVAKSRHVTLNSIPATCCVTSTQLFSFSKYKAISAYAGARYYTNRYWCDRAAFFIGAKIGFTHHDKVNVMNNLGLNDLLYEKNNVVSGGGLVGFDVILYNCLSFIFTAEAIPTGSPLHTILPSNPFVPAVRIEVVFPILFGLKYTF